MQTFLDFTFLRTLPEAQIRNGFAELIKISTCAHLPTFELLDKYCEQLITTGFGRCDGAAQEVRDAADAINRSGIHEMLKLETLISMSLAWTESSLMGIRRSHSSGSLSFN